MSLRLAYSQRLKKTKKYLERAGDRSQPNAVVREAITKLSQERMQRTSKVSPSSLGIFYKVEALLYEILLKEQSSPEQQNTEL